jgi:hypothetical protein
MPANLPAACKAQYNKVLQARNPQEKLKALEAFYSMIPKHKGTEKLRMHVRRQMAALKAQMEEAKRKKLHTAAYSWFLAKHGAAQIVLLGLTKTGKSSLLAKLTNAKSLVAGYPYATVEPEVGMLTYEDIQFQLVEAPSLKPEPENQWNLKPLTLARNADGLIIMVDLSANPRSQLELILKMLEDSKISPRKPRGRVVISSSASGIQVIGKVLDATVEEVVKLLTGYGVRNAIVKVYGEAALDDVEDALFEGLVYKPTLVVANKADIAELDEKLVNHCQTVKLPILKTSCITGENLDKIGKTLFETLEIIRVYTKPPSAREPSSQPFLLRSGATVAELAEKIHRGLAEKFRYARVWSGTSRTSVKVGREYLLKDGDIVEIRGG